MFRENVLDGTKRNVSCDVWRGDRLRVVGVVRKHVGYGKRVAGKSLDLTVTLVIGNHIGAIVGTPRMYLVAMFALGL